MSISFITRKEWERRLDEHIEKLRADPVAIRRDWLASRPLFDALRPKTIDADVVDQGACPVNCRYYPEWAYDDFTRNLALTANLPDRQKEITLDHLEEFKRVQLASYDHFHPHEKENV